MQLIETVQQMQRWSDGLRAQGKSIGLVPTMGFLHEGHLSLVAQSCADNDATVVSIFVNPTQFGPSEDYEQYPRDLERDSELLSDYPVDVIFSPNVAEMYPAGYATYVEATGTLTTGLCGSARPSHFRGVTTIVTKLFGCVRPHRGYFGQKDAQQLAVIQRMTADLNLGVEIVPMPTTREADGLAMSSRNRYLSDEERKAALVLYQTLQHALQRIAAGEEDAAKLHAEIVERIQAEPLAQIDYVEIVRPRSMEPVELLHGPIMVALAVFIGTTRLIDNLQLVVG